VPRRIKLLAGTFFDMCEAGLKNLRRHLPGCRLRYLGPFAHPVSQGSKATRCCRSTQSPAGSAIAIGLAW
jgi:hypothetical protein